MDDFLLLEDGDALLLESGDHLLLNEPTPAPVGTTYASRRVRRFALPYNDNRWVFLKRIEFICQPGMGLSTGQGSDPIVMMRLSANGGRTWGNEIQLHAGRIGQYKRRLYAFQLGRYRDGYAEIVVSDPVPWFFLSCTVEIDAGTS